jgi:polar amino acid transport system substrate-binding protein
VPPEFDKDPNTGKLSGIGYEVTEAIGRLLGLRIDWVEEVGFGEMAAGLAAGRYDAVCSSVFNRAPLARQADFTVPFMYTPVGIFVRANDNRFDRDVTAINDPSVVIATIDGETANEIASQDFPKTKRFSMPQNTSVAMLLESVATKKGDVAFTYMANFYRYNKANPGKLKSIRSDKPVRAFGNTIMVLHGEDEFKNMLNVAVNELLNSGAIESIISKYEPYLGAYYRVQTAYRVP